MNDPNFYQGQQNPVVIPPPDQQQQQQQSAMGYQFSPDELRVLRECNRESLLQRSLPIGTGLGLLAYYCVKQGYLSASPRFGAGPKVLLGATVGYFLGKISYQEKCAEKLMKLPNSRLAEMLRQKKKGGMYEGFSADGNVTLAPFSSKSPDLYSDESYRPGSLDLDTSRPQTDIDDSFRQPIDGSFEDNLPLEPPKNITTYDELRKKNREEYEKRQQNPFNRPLPQREAPVVLREPTEPREDPVARNKYGDVWLK